MNTLKQIYTLTMPGDFKGTDNPKIEWGIERTTYKFYFSKLLRKKFALCAFGQYTKRRKKY
jgi:hypothetical protein